MSHPVCAMGLVKYIYFFHHTTCESTCDTLASSAANQGDNTVSVAQGGTATPGATEQLLPPDRVFKNTLYIYTYCHFFHGILAKISEFEVIFPTKLLYKGKIALTAQLFILYHTHTHTHIYIYCSVNVIIPNFSFKDKLQLLNLVQRALLKQLLFNYECFIVCFFLPYIMPLV